MNEEATKSVKKAKYLGEEQYQQYAVEILIKCKVPVYEKIQKNKLSMYREKNKVCSSKGKIKAVSLKQEKNLYASMFVACQLRDCNLSEFFKHENHSYPSSFSEYRKYERQANQTSCLV